MVVARRRPGQRAIASKAADSRGYDVDLDRLIRARAKFEGLSLGQASSKYGGDCKMCVPVVRSYIAKDEHPTLVNDELTSEELEIIFSVKDFAEGRSTPLKLANPALHKKVLQVLVSTAEERLAKARWARHTPSVLAYARYLDSLPRHRLLVIDQETSSYFQY